MSTTTRIISISNIILNLRMRGILRKYTDSSSKKATDKCMSGDIVSPEKTSVVTRNMKETDSVFFGHNSRDGHIYRTRRRPLSGYETE